MAKILHCLLPRNSKRVLKTSATALSTPEGIILKQGYVGVKGKKSTSDCFCPFGSVSAYKHPSMHRF